MNELHPNYNHAPPLYVYLNVIYILNMALTGFEPTTARFEKVTDRILMLRPYRHTLGLK